MPDYYIGLMSGTSMDGVDAVVAAFGDRSVELQARTVVDYSSDLKLDLADAVRDPHACSVDFIGALDRRVGAAFRDAALAVIGKAGLQPGTIRAIGSHGQTLRHQPDAAQPFSVQIGDASTIAQGTGITTVADFRRADIAAGGQGAPLVPPFHDWLFGDTERHQAILNIGGIANLTILGAGHATVTGFDTGPGNTLLDAWTQRHRGEPFDRDGDWAAQGKVIESLLAALLTCDYFERRPPKSTGLEEFNLDWLASRDAAAHGPVDVQATLCELTARTIAADIGRYAPATEQIHVCGGGVHNRELMRRLVQHLPRVRIESTAAAGLDPDWVEAAAFAWLAMRTMSGQTGNLPSVTGASRKVILGAIHSP